LLVDTATHASLLVDTGWGNVNGHSADPIEKGMHDAGEPDQTGRDAERIQAAMRDAGITRIDHVLITHFHTDHVVACRNWSSAYMSANSSTTERTAKTLTSPATITPHIQSHSRKAAPHRASRRYHPHSRPHRHRDHSRWEHIAAVPGVKRRPSHCATEPHWDLDTTENPRSTGVLIRFGKFRFLI